MTHTTVLVTRHPSVINQLQQLHDETEEARLEVCGRLEKALTRLEHGGLLLVHLESGTDASWVHGILRSLDPGLVTTVLLSTARSETGVEASPLQSLPTYQLPNDLANLRVLLGSRRSGRGQPNAGPDPSAPVDPVASALLHGDFGDDLARIHRVASQDTTVLLTGETGCGKSLLAKYVHSCSARRDAPYLVVDCGALAGHLIESEMFGHVRGAFTGAERERQGKLAAAGTGTLVLDEINSLPLPLQAKLLRAVEDRVFEPVGSNKSEPLRARLVAVSNVPLEEEIRRERFRADLYYRLNVVEFRLPPLRERPSAIIPLARQFLRESATAACHGVNAISAVALEAMLAYRWPGNVRELRNVIERAAALAAGPVIQPADLPESIRGRNSYSLSATATVTALSAAHREIPALVTDTPQGDEATKIVGVLRKHNNNRRRAAAELGMSRMSLYKKLHKYGLFIRKQRVVD
jgi:DNA-binding NtrC family response regulator